MPEIPHWTSGPENTVGISTATLKTEPEVDRLVLTVRIANGPASLLLTREQVVDLRDALDDWLA